MVTLYSISRGVFLKVGEKKSILNLQESIWTSKKIIYYFKITSYLVQAKYKTCAILLCFRQWWVPSAPWTAHLLLVLKPWKVLYFSSCMFGYTNCGWTKCVLNKNNSIDYCHCWRFRNKERLTLKSIKVSEVLLLLLLLLLLISCDIHIGLETA